MVNGTVENIVISNSYPIMKKAPTDFVVMFTAVNTGMVVQSTVAGHSVGEYSVAWTESMFVDLPITQKVTLVNS